MGRDLFDTVEAFRTDKFYCDAILQSLRCPSILPIIQGRDAIMEADLLAIYCVLLAL